MAGKTTHYEFIQPTYNDYDDVENQNENWEKADNELFKRIKTVNGEEPDANGAVIINEVPFARQIVTENEQQSSGEYIERTTGGEASVSDGNATLVSIYGRREHYGYAAESLTMTVDPVARQEGEEAITAEIDRDTFVNYVQTSGTTTLIYTDAWSANPTLYGVTVTGTPVAGDKIIIVYVKEERGTIVVSNPTAFRSTGWNLYNHSVGYARVLKYSDQYGFLIGGTYTGVKFSETLDGTQITITPVGGYFTIPSDGYIWVTGGNSTNTYVLMTWSDWSNGYEGSFNAYTESTVSLSSVMSNFPYGLMQVAGIADEINLNMNQAISRIERMAYTTENLAAIIASGRTYEYDENYIYAVRELFVTYDISVSGTYTASDHGLEFVDGTEVPVFVQTLYGENLVDYLRHDVPANFTAVNNGIAAIQDGMAIVANGNTHVAIAAGQFVYVKNHSSLAQGLYKAKSAISANATLSTSNLEADSSGGLNALSDQIAKIDIGSNTLAQFGSTTTSGQEGLYIRLFPDATTSYRLLVREDMAVLQKYDNGWTILKTLVDASQITDQFHGLKFNPLGSYSGTVHEINMPSSSRHFVMQISTSGGNYGYAGMIAVTSGGTIVNSDFFNGTNVTVTKSTNTLTFTYGSSTSSYFYDFVLSGDACSRPT